MSEKLLILPDVTLVAISCDRPKETDKALDICMDYAMFGDIKFFTSARLNNRYRVSIPRINNIRDYDRFVIQKLGDYIHTDYALTIHWDGFILNPKAWSAEFLEYDYIGAPWKHHKGLVGNGGFCLRSKKLLRYLVENYSCEQINRPDDVFICQDIRQELIDAGFKFAPYSIAKRFSIENGTWNGQFGFHDFDITDITQWRKQ
ncbi:hypothetical protein EG832_02890 [bacterium]|nr:hypothetical protein [bacterium]